MRNGRRRKMSRETDLTDTDRRRNVSRNAGCSGKAENNTAENPYGFVAGLKAGIPIALGYFAVSFTFGIQSLFYGLSVGEAVLFSLSNLTSAGQFAGLDIIAADSGYLTMALSQFIINLRYLLMSTALSQKFSPDAGNGSRMLAAFGITDEIFGVAATAEGTILPSYMYGMMCVAIPGWTFGTFVGAYLGSILPESVLSALGIAIYGMFIAIFIPPCRHSKAVLIVVLSSMGLSSIFAFAPYLKNISGGIRVIIITIAVAAAAAWIAPVPDEKEETAD